MLKGNLQDARMLGSMLRHKFVRSMLMLLTVIFIVATAENALGEAGTHGMSVSTFDTTRSSIVFAFRNGFIDGGHLRLAGYNANFTSSSGKLSAQFGLHYLNYLPQRSDNSFHGLGVTAITVYSVPIGQRYDNGLPKAAFTLFFGGAPSAIISKTYNLISFAVPIGMGIPFWPSKHVGIVPWIELALSFNIDTIINPYSSDNDDPSQWVNPETGKIEIDANKLDNIMEEAINLQTSFDTRFRGGLSLVFNLGDRADLTIDGAVGQVGPEFGSDVTIFIGGSLAIAWDDPPPSILPAEKRLEGEECREVYKRFKQCPFYPKMIEKAEKRGAEKCIEGTHSIQEDQVKAKVNAPPITSQPR